MADIEYTEEIIMIKRTVRTRKHVSSPSIELCLCRRCARAFYNSAHHFIKRADPFQTVMEPCTYCSYRSGYDYLIFDFENETDRRED